MTDLQSQLQESYDLVEKQINEIKGLLEHSYKTNGCFRYNPTNSYSNLDIHSTVVVSELIHAYSFLKLKSEHYEQAAHEMGLTEYPVFKWCGFIPSDWFEDIKHRLKLIKSEGQLSKLKELKAKMERYLPEENEISKLLVEIKPLLQLGAPTIE